jgi:alpha-tubulin suppressor-like RCC1 family protein
VLAWGDDEFGQLGNDATSLASFSPVVVSGASNIVAIAAGGNHSLALKSDGTLLAWGANFSGQLGNDDSSFLDKFTPVPVVGASNIVAIAGGLNHSLALKKDGTVLAWGSDEKGQLGDGTTLADKTTPTPVSGASDIVAIAAGGLHSLALKSNGTMQSWGEDEQAQLGNGATTGNQASPIDVLLGALTIRLP